MTRPLQHRPDEHRETSPERPAAGAAPPMASEQILQLQRSAGNAAVARVLAREPAADAPLVSAPAKPFDLRLPGLGLGMGGLQPELKPEVQRAVDAWLGSHGPGMLQFGIPMPVAIDQVRRGVPEAADANPSAIADRIRAVVGPLPATRANADLGQQKAELQSRVANSLPKPPTSVTVGTAQTYVKVEILSAELKTPHVTVKVDKEGGEAEVSKGGAKVGVSGKWDGSEFGLKTEVGGVKFGGKVHKKGDGWGWSGGLVIPLYGDEVDELPDVGSAVGAAHTAVTESLGHLQGGGSPTDGFVTGRMAQIKPAIDAIGEVAARKGKSGATLRITASGDANGFYAGVSLVIAF